MIGLVGAMHLFLLVGCAVDYQEANMTSHPNNLSTCEYPATLEITSINIGQGDATLVATPTKLLLADVGESYWNSTQDARAIDAAIVAKYGCRKLDYVVISHFHVDHIGYVGYGGLYYLANDLGYIIGETLVRDYIGNVGTTSQTYNNWVTYLGSQDGIDKLNPQPAAVNDELDLGSDVTAKIVSVDTRTASCPDGWGSKPDLSCGGEYVWPSEVLGVHSSDYPAPDENGYSVSLVVSLGDFDMFIGGDITGETADSGYGAKYHDVETYLAGDVGEVDILRISHHGSDHSTNATFLATLDPQVAVLSVGNANTYGHARQTVIDIILGVVGGVPMRDTWIYATERGDDGIGGCLTDYQYSDRAASKLYDRATIVSDTDGDYCTIEGGDVDIVVAPDGSSFTVEGYAYFSSAGSTPICDNDGLCETDEDCLNCPADCPQGAGAACGNGLCEAGNGEDCLSCPDDCRGKQNGNPSKMYCCGDGDGVGSVSCSDSRCTSEGFACTSVAATASCCGDLTCNGLEDSCGCAIDCGAPADSETACADGFDDDCDGYTDCVDFDCDDDTACAPPPCDNDGVCDPGEDCHTCSGDCASLLTGKPAKRYCCGDGVPQQKEGDGTVCDGNF
jgi:beta-lactamase superfamily II metal-dependent hydrolase